MKQIKQALANRTFKRLTNNRNKILTKETDLDGYSNLLANVYRYKGHENDLYLLVNAPEWLEQLVSKVEEMQKTLEWYADEKNHNDLILDRFVPYTAIDDDGGERARQALKGVTL
jgi:hypothetical protein